MNVILLFRAYQATSIAIAVTTHYLAPLFVALSAPVLLREKAAARTFVAAALGFSGLLVMLRPWAADRSPTDSLGAAFGAGSAVFYASNVIVNKRLSRTFSGGEMMFFHGLVAIPVLAAFVPIRSYFLLHAGAALWLALGAFGPGAMSGLLFVWGLRRVPASHASTLTLLEPLVAVLLGALTYREPLRVSLMVGGVVILASAAIVMSKPAEERAAPVV